MSVCNLSHDTLLSGRCKPIRFYEKKDLLRKGRMPKMRFLTIFFSILLTEVASGPLFQNVYQFLGENGHHYVDVFYNSSSNNWIWFRPKDISVATIPMSEVKRMRKNSFGVFIFENQAGNLETYLKIITERKVRMTLLLHINPAEDGSYERILEYLEDMKTPSFFYVAKVTPRPGIMLWQQVFSLTSGAIIDDLTFVGNSYKIKDSFDLKGLEVRSTSLSWDPFYTIDGCNEVGLECAPSYGYLEDYMNMLSKSFNFTYSSHKNMDNDWGLIPDDNGTYRGVLGDISSKKYDMSMSVWWWLIERDGIADHIIIAKNREVLAMKSGKSKTDFGLFTRVFTDNSWITISFMILALSACIFLVKPCASHLNTKRGTNLMIFTLLIFFVVIRAYYGGALTKFFTVTVSEPFESKMDVMKAYPRYNLMIRAGNEGLYYFWMETGDPEYEKFWRRLVENPEKSKYSSEKEGLDIIGKDTKNVIVCDETLLLGYLKTNVNEQAPYLFAHDRWKYINLMLHKNSPMTPVLKHGVERLREKGIEQQLRLKWIGVGEQDQGATLNAIVLNPGQVILIFALMMVIYGVTLVLLCGEVLTSKIRAAATGHISKTSR